MDFYNILFIFHIVTGILALIGGVTEFLSRKRKSISNFSGNIFFFSMILSSVSSLLLCVINFNPFFLGIGLFTLYIILGGKLVIKKNESLNSGLWKRYSQFGILITILMFTPALYLLYVEQWMLSILLLFFGGVQILFTREDLKKSIDTSQ